MGGLIWYMETSTAKGTELVQSPIYPYLIGGALGGVFLAFLFETDIGRKILGFLQDWRPIGSLFLLCFVVGRYMYCFLAVFIVAKIFKEVPPAETEEPEPQTNS